MAHFTLDTSGAVKGYVRDFWRGAPTPPVNLPGGYTGPNEWGITWEDLPNDFVRGYIWAMLTALGEVKPRWNAMDERTELECAAYSDLAPETVAAILKDCAAFAIGLAGGHQDQNASGAGFWAARQKGFGKGSQEALYAQAFPPQTPYLGDDGRVYLRGAA